MQQDVHEGFQTVTQQTDVDFLFRFLDVADANQSVQDYRQQMFDLAPPVPGQRILDVGSGIGTVALQLSATTGASGQVVGIDKNPLFIREAQRRANERNLPAVFQVADAQNLEFPDGSFDIARAERTLMYMEHAERTLDELVRVLRPGGQLVILEFEYDAMVIDAPNHELKRRIVGILSDSVPNGAIGRQAARLLRERGLEHVTAIPKLLLPTFAEFKMAYGGTLDQAVERGDLTADELAAWWSTMEEAQQSGNFYVGVLGFIVYGRKPQAAA